MTLFLVTSFGIATFLMVFLNLELAVCMFVFILPFERLFISTGIPGLNIITIITLPLCYFYLISNQNTTDKQIEIKYQFRSALILIMLWTTFCAFSPLLTGSNYLFDIRFQIFELKRWLTYFLFFFIFANIRPEFSMRKKIILSLALGYSFESFHVFKEFILVGRNRLVGSLANPNELGAFLSSFWVIGWMSLKLITTHKYFLNFIRIGMILGVICVTLTLSRGSYLALTATFVTFIFFQSKKLFVFSILLLLTCILQYDIILPKFMVDRINESFVENSEFVEYHDKIIFETESNARLLFWKAGIKMFKERPLLGVGFSQFPGWIPYYGAEFGLQNPRPPHNMYIRILTEQGILGFGIFIWMLYCAFGLAFSLYRENDDISRDLGMTYCTILVGLCVSMFFGDRLSNGPQVGYFFIFSGVVWNHFVNQNQINYIDR